MNNILSAKILDAKLIDLIESTGYTNGDSQNVYGSAAVTHFVYTYKHTQEFLENFLREHGHEKVNA